MTLWPVYLMAEMQGDSPKLFELSDVLTWPVVLVDAGAAGSGWPTGVPIETTVTLQAGPRPQRSRLARTPELSACWRGQEPIGSELRIGAGLFADFFNPPFTTYVTGTVRRIEVVASRFEWQEQDRGGSWIQSGEWDRRDVPVAPVRFDHGPPGDPSARREHGLLVHLELTRAAHGSP